MARFLPLALLGALILTRGALCVATRVVDLTPDNFDTLTQEGEWMIEFYAPWCGHCKRLSPIWDEASKALAGKVNFAKVDAQKYRSLGFRFGVNGFPTLFHIKANGGSREVRRAAVQHTLESITSYAEDGVWKSYAPLPTVSGPYGPAALAKFNVAYYGDKVMGLQEPISTATGLPTVVIQFVFLMLVLLGISGAIIGFAVYLGPKQHAD